MRFSIIIVFLLVLAFSTNATNIDSLKLELNQNGNTVLSEDSEALLKVLSYYYSGNGRNDDSLYRYSFLYGNFKTPKLQADIAYYKAAAIFNQDTSFAFIKIRNCIKIYRSLDDYCGLGKSYYALGKFKGQIAEYQKKISHTLQAIEYFNQCKEQKNEGKALFNCYIALSSAYMKDGAFLKALETAIISEKLASSTQSQLQAAINLTALYGNLSLDDLNYGTQEDRKQYEKQSLGYSLKAYALAETMDIAKYTCKTSFNLGLYYSEKEDWGKSNFYLKKCIATAKNNNLYNQLFSGYDILGDNYRETGQLDSSDYFIYQAYEAAQHSLSNDIKIKAEHALVDLFYHKGDYKEAIIKAHKGLRLATKYNLIRRKQSAYYFLYELNKLIGENELAFDFYEKYHELKDSIVNEQTIQDIESLKVKYEQAEKEKEIALLQQEKLSQKVRFHQELALTGIILFLLLAIGSFILFKSRTRSLKNKQKATELEQRLLRSQMNPHFTFNALSSIQTYLLKSGQAKKGAYYLAKFAKLMRQILSQTRTSFISIDEEILTLENYLSIQKLRYEDSFKYQFSIDKSINTTTTQIPPMLIQPILENAIEHGKVYTLENGKININISQINGFLSIKIADNGIGRSSEIASRAKDHESVSMGIITDRIAILRERYGEKINFNIIDPENRGTEVHFRLPFIVK